MILYHENYKHKTLIEEIRKWDNNRWKQEIQNKSSLILYKRYKACIKEEQYLYDNSPASTTLFRARTGTLKLEQ